MISCRLLATKLPLVVCCLLLLACPANPRQVPTTAAPTFSPGMEDQRAKLARLNFQEMLSAGQFAELDQQMQSCLANNQYYLEDGEFLLGLAYSKFHLEEQWLPQYDAWCKQQPDSSYACTVRGIFYINYAWQARGGGWARTVSDQNRKLFHERLQQAHNDLDRAIQLNPRDPFPSSHQITVCMGEGLPKAEMEKYFEQSIKLEPRLYRSYSCALEYLKGKWRGNDRQMFDFARKSYQRAPEQSWVDGILLDAHLEMGAGYHEGDGWWSRPEVWLDLEQLFTRRLNKGFGLNHNRNNYARLAQLCGQKQIATEQFKLIGADWDYVIWSSVEKYLEQLSKAFAASGEMQPPATQEWFIAQVNARMAKDPNNPFYPYTRGSVYFLQKNYSAAETDLRQAAQMKPENDFYQAELGRVLAQRQKHHEALAAYQAALRLQPKKFDYARDVAAQLRRLDQPDSATALLKQYSEQDGRDTQVMCSRGDDLMEQKKADQALEHYNQALEQSRAQGHGDNYEAMLLCRRARCYRALNERDKELTDLLQAHELAPGQASVITELAWYYTDQKQPDKALPLYQQARQLKPDDLYLTQMLAASLTKLKRHEEAFALYEELLAKEPANLDYQESYGGTLLTAGKHEQALAQFNQTIALAEQRQADSSALIRYYSHRARCFEALKRYPEQHADLEHTLQLQPDDEMVITHTARRMVLCDDPAARNPQRGLELAEKAVAMTQRKKGGALEALAVAYEQLGQKDKAIQINKELLQLDPKSKKARARLDNLEGRAAPPAEDDATTATAS